MPLSALLSPLQLAPKALCHLVKASKPSTGLTTLTVPGGRGCDRGSDHLDMYKANALIITHPRTAETIKYVRLGIEICAEIYLGPQGQLQIVSPSIWAKVWSDRKTRKGHGEGKNRPKMEDTA